jgi:hypothetical protein
VTKVSFPRLKQTGDNLPEKNFLSGKLCPFFSFSALFGGYYGLRS